jgi:hypothetical protein
LRWSEYDFIKQILVISETVFGCRKSSETFRKATVLVNIAESIAGTGFPTTEDGFGNDKS